MFQSLLYKLYATLSIILTFHSINTDQGKLKNILYVWHLVAWEDKLHKVMTYLCHLKTTTESTNKFNKEKIAFSHMQLCTQQGASKQGLPGYRTVQGFLP
jgi:hypothetical protein